MKKKYWLDLSQSDLQAAKTLLAGKHYLQCAFMCHQAVEKSLKAVIAKIDIFPPKSHYLRDLAILGKIYQNFTPLQLKFLDELDPLNLESRYPSYKSEIAKKLNNRTCTALYKKTE
jgi:HEPN domain-containing protein